ncbi:hypothetical protein S7S_11820 [Isoalcanivorax pacificus W11-5]|uniref:VPS37 C-terminal domain-containing protein n=1 Tax=Isoalcanivorax pacificus W11-5 TaxID=391936 RepID=A0A0B4XNT4_9GAMM|nr:OmpH family outer membrane protein [Isoalcanivorax pacificus]AJD48776.1 hypothetical protein S7S_11820 [Isoalcanivorax pacificus W11-5]
MAERKEYIERIREKLEQWNTELTRLEQQARDAGEEARRNWETRKPELEQVLADMEQRVREARNHAGDTWDATRARLEQGWQKINRELHELTERLFPGN